MNARLAIERYFRNCHKRKYPANSTIVNAGDHSNSLYYIVSGSVSVVIEDDGAHEMVLAYLNAGDFFGEIGMFDERRERSAWVRAKTNSEIAQLSYDRLTQMAEESPEIVFAMMSETSLRVRDTTRKVGDLAFRDVTGRIARTLLDLCQSPEAEVTDEGTRIEVTRQELGRIVGCSREMASRVLHNLEDRQMLDVQGKFILIYTSPTQLKNLGDA